jgi:carboxylesterase
MSAELIPGAEAWSHTGESSVGVLVLHGFTGNPGSMRGLSEALADAGFHVEMPRLAGHGTAVEDMLPTRWADWSDSAEAAYQTLQQRCSTVVVAGLSMGGSLTLWLASRHPEIIGLICVNPATQSQPAEVLDLIQGMVDSGTIMMPGIGSDIADPAATESAYSDTPLACLLSMMTDGLSHLEPLYPQMRMPLLLLTSPQDHVVEPKQGDFLAQTYGGSVSRVSLERSYHVATQDYDKELIFAEAVAFVQHLGNS